MTDVEILDAFLSKHKLRRMKGESMRLVMPWYIMDKVYDIYQNDIKDFDVKGRTQMMNKYRNMWKNSYNKFNLDFFDCFDEDQTDEIIERFNEFHEYTGRNVMLLYYAVLDVFQKLQPDKDLKWQETASKCFLVELMTSYALKLWKDITFPAIQTQIRMKGAKATKYRANIEDASCVGWIRGVAKKIEDVRYSAMCFGRTFYDPSGMMDQARIDRMHTNGTALFNRILLYTNESNA